MPIAAMALQTVTTTDTGSVPSPTGTQPVALPVPSDTPTNDLNTRNSVPFSFLIAFLALFVVFMGMGLWARRIVFFARRQLGLPVPDEIPYRRQVSRAQRPVLWDVYPDKFAQSEKWEGIQVCI